MSVAAITYVMAPTREQLEAAGAVWVARDAAKRMSSDALAELAADEAHRIEQGERAAILAGIRSTPDATRVAAAAGFWQIADIMIEVARHEDEFRTIYKSWIRERGR